MDILNLPPDLYTRNILISKLIDAVRAGAPSLRVLDVGGRGGQLQYFLEHDELNILDIRHPGSEDPRRYVLGDIYFSPFTSGSFDVVIASELYEHIPSERRFDAVSQMLRLSRNYIIVGAPFSSEEIREAEIKVNSYWRDITGQPYIWLQEHLEQALPSENDLESFLTKAGYEFRKLGTNNISNWLMLQLFYSYIYNYDASPDKVQVAHRFYNKYFIELGDFLEPTYRKLYLIGERGTLPDVNIYPVRTKIDVLKYQEFTKRIFDTIAECVQLRDAKISELTDALHARDSDISELTNSLQARVAQISELNDALQARVAQISELNDALQARDAQISELTNALHARDAQISELTDAMQARVAQISELKVVIHNMDIHQRNLESSIEQMQGTIFMRLASKYQGVVEKLLHTNTTRRNYYELLLRGLRIILNEGWSSFLFKGKLWLKNQRRLPRIANPIKTGKKRKNRLNQESPIKISEREYVHLSNPNVPETDIKLIAFYLPQFHPIPENDEWWGKGFTDWANVTSAVPQFIGHYQPRLPGELGFYDLRIPEVQKRQIELAKQYGIYGFCFHFYWFNGKRLLEKPLEKFLSNPEMDSPFCINWANENWSRRWDGLDDDMLIVQDHSAEDDVAFIEYVSRYLEDPRYIRIDSKPLLIVYRPALLPDPKKTAQRWREWCHKNGIGSIYLALTHAFEHIDPREIGFDAAIEFAPNTFPLRDIKDRFDIVNDKFQGKIFDYNEALDIAKNYRKTPYKKFRSLCPGWDNEARRPGRGTVLANSSPEAYGKWLRIICDFTINNFDSEERIIFVNAWNEWAEGAYLEPDRKYGYAYLNKTGEVLSYFPKGSTASLGKWKILFISHDACRAGAQSVLLNIISWFKKHTFINVKILCMDGGEWLHRFKELGDTLVLSDLRKKNTPEEDILQQLQEFCGGAPDLIYGNSVAAGREYRLLHQLNAPIITHFHELEMSIQRYAANFIGDALKHSSHFIACSGAIRENLVKNHGVDRSKIDTVYSGISPDSSIRIASDAEKRKIRKRLGIEENKFIIFGCGIGMVFRKGADLFIEVARILHRKGFDNFHFYWIGGFDRTESDDRYGIWTDHITALRKDGLYRCVTFLGLKDKPREYLQSGDIFLLPSREDPFPLVALEAAECGLPIVCFANSGGMPEFVEEDAGFVVPYEDVEAMAEKVVVLKQNEDLRRKLGDRAREKLLSHFTPGQTTPHILSACRKVAQKKPALSVIVPNYNHARYLPRRLDSIFNQTFKDFEVILLDDASTDNSMEVLEKYADHADVRIVRNERNTGSPCAQWLKGIDIAKADIIWIAESDDACEPQLLETLMPAFRDPTVKLVYADSYCIDEDDRVTGDYVNCEYLTSLSQTKWKKSYQVSSTEEINDGLGVKNTILNISSALFRKQEFNYEFLKIIEGMRIAGDWYFIVHAIKDGEIYYEAKKLNYHRRHSESVIGNTVSGKNIGDFYREFYTVQQFIFNNYKLDSDFHEKWESYMRKQWNDFCPNRPFEELNNYFPLDEMKEMILQMKNILNTSVDERR